MKRNDQGKSGRGGKSGSKPGSDRRRSSDPGRERKSYGSGRKEDKPSFGDKPERREYPSRERSDRPDKEGSDSFKRKSYDTNRDDRPKRTDERFGDKKRDYSSKRDDRGGDKRRSYGSDNRDDRPKREFDPEKRKSDYPKREDRGVDRRKSFGSVNRDDRPKRDNDDRGGYKGRNDSNRFSRDDRPKREGHGGAEKRRDFDADKRKGYGDKRRESGGDGLDSRFGFINKDNDSPRKSFGKDNDSPRKSFGKDNKRTGFGKDKKADPGLKRTRKYRDGDEKIIGNWRKDIPASDGETTVRDSQSNLPNSLKGNADEIRLNKYISNSGVCSRREADDLITGGFITVNGEVVTELGHRVNVNDEIRFKGRLLVPEKLTYILMNKPKDTITTVDDPEGRRTIMEFLPDDITERVFPVGRLDRNTTGVILLTNDGDLSQKLTHPSFGVHKVYKAELDKPMSKADFEALLNGVELEDGLIKPDELAYLDESRTVLGVEIHSGKNHIVHRMFNHLGYLVDKLDRVSFAGLSKDGLKKGEFRYLSEKEVNKLRKSSGSLKS